MIELLLFGDRRQVAVDAAHREAADLEVQVRGALFDRELQQIVDVHDRLSAVGPSDGRCRTGVSQSWVSGKSPRKMPKNRFCSASVIGPRLPLPTVILSIERIGVISTAVPQKNASSAR